MSGKFEDLVSRFEIIVTHLREVESSERCERLLKIADGKDDDERLIVLEVWKNIDAHKKAAAAIDPEALSTVMALLREKPSGQYYAAI